MSFAAAILLMGALKPCGRPLRWRARLQSQRRAVCLARPSRMVLDVVSEKRFGLFVPLRRDKQN